MNRSIIRYILGWVLKIEAILMLLPCVVAIIYRENSGIAFLFSAALCGALGFAISFHKPENTLFYLKEGCIATSLSWILLSIFGCLPFVISGEIRSFTDALFETISGFTTTGASILPNVEELSHCMLFWRSFTHWIGGMGVLVFLLAIIPLSGGSNINLMRAESPGPSVGKLVPKIKYTARILYLLYLALTALQILLLAAGRLPLFDSICTALGTAGTGGFGIKADSIAGYSPYIQWVVTIFMILFGVNFNFYYLIIFGKIKDALHMEEVIYYILIILAAVGIIFTQIYTPSLGIENALRHSSFQVASIITTTGFATVDFDLWSEAAKTVLVFLMFIGACAGSTGGGIKVSRFVIETKSIIRELYSFIHPKSVRRIKMDGKPVEHEVIRTVNVYFITFLFIFSASLLALSFEGNDLITNFTAVAATINNIGPGLAMVGPTQSFVHFNIFSKYVLMFDMLAGRLELFPLLILFHPTMIKDMLTPRKRVQK